LDIGENGGKDRAMSFDTLIRNGTAVVPRVGLRNVDIAIDGGKIAALLEHDEAVRAEEEIDAKGHFIFPGLIDPHMHIGFVGQPLTDVRSETRSAAIGGVTSIINYLLKPGSYSADYDEFLDHIDRLAYVDMGLHLGIFSSEHVAKIPHYIDDLGVSSFKLFMSYKGNEGVARGVGTTDEGLFYELAKAVAGIPGTVVNVHTENIEMIWRAEEEVKAQGLDGLAAHNAARPAAAEATAMMTAAYISRSTHCPFYLVHMSCEESAREFAGIRSSETPVFIETTPHYLSLNVDSKCGLLAKVNPPVRTAKDVDYLWASIKAGLIDTVGCDHSARFRAEKQGGVWKAGAAFPGVGTMLSILLTEGYHRRAVSLQRLAEISSFNTARIFNLYPRKGTIEVGSDADLAIVDLEKEMVVDPGYLQSRADFSPWEGERLKGWSVRTLVRGQTVMKDGEIVGEEGFGKYLRRPPSSAIELVAESEALAKVATG
jgi:dihydropyrimidinase